jgi:hypothetical protein
MGWSALTRSRSDRSRFISAIGVRSALLQQAATQLNLDVDIRAAGSWSIVSSADRSTLETALIGLKLSHAQIDNPAIIEV